MSNPDLKHFTTRLLMGIMVSTLILACSVLVPKPTPAVTLTPTPQFIALPPPQNLTNQVAAQAGGGFRYLPWHYVPDTTVVWLLFGWPEEDLLYKAVFTFDGDGWVLSDVEKMGDETLPPVSEEAW